MASPGHYHALMSFIRTNPKIIFQVYSELKATPASRGLQIRYEWPELEPEEGIGAAEQTAGRAAGMKSFKPHVLPVPSYMATVPYEGGASRRRGLEMHLLMTQRVGYDLLRFGIDPPLSCDQMRAPGHHHATLGEEQVFGQRRPDTIPDGQHQRGDLLRALVSAGRARFQAGVLLMEGITSLRLRSSPSITEILSASAIVITHWLQSRVPRRFDTRYLHRDRISLLVTYLDGKMSHGILISSWVFSSRDGLRQP